MTNLLLRALLIASLGTAACWDSSTTAGGPDATPIPDVTNDFDDETTYVYGSIILSVPGSFSFETVPGVQVCLQSHPELPCVTSDDDGAYRIDGIPADTEIVLSAQKSGVMGGATQTRTVPSGGQEMLLIVTDEVAAAALVRPLGYEFPMVGVGMVRFRFRKYSGGGLNGAVISANVGDVIYTGSGSIPDPDLTSSRRGDGMIFEVPVGEVTLDVVADGYRCNLGDMGAFPGANENQVRAVVHENTLTRVDVTCAAYAD